MKKRKVVEPPPAPTDPAVMCDKCCRIVTFGTLPPTWTNCGRCA